MLEPVNVDVSSCGGLPQSERNWFILVKLVRTLHIPGGEAERDAGSRLCARGCTWTSWRERSRRSRRTRCACATPVSCGSSSRERPTAEARPVSGCVTTQLIFVHPCYPRLLEVCLELTTKIETRHVVILGNPGIGKTYFALIHLARVGAAVVYDHGATKTRYLLTSTFAQRGSLEDFSEYLDSSSTFYIVDSTKPVDVSARTILLSSPRKDTWYKFSDDNCEIRYMPVWTRGDPRVSRGAVSQCGSRRCRRAVREVGRRASVRAASCVSSDPAAKAGAGY